MKYLIGVAAVVVIIIIVIARYYKNEEFTPVSSSNDSNDTQLVENYPTNPQNVLVSDASGNLTATSDLGLQSLTVAGNAQLGNLNVKDRNILGNLDELKAKIDALVPKGSIIMWNGTTAPGGWAICDGGSGTPDLRNRFIVGVGSGYVLGATGGEALHTLTEAEMPKHTHQHSHAPVYFADTPGGDMAQGGGTKATPPKWTTDPTGGSQPHENRPPYYALCYIMKL
jgi:microcystin-dependent protein